MWAPRLIRDRGPVALRAVAAQKIAVAVEIHHRVGDFVRAVPRIEIEHLVVLAAAVLAISPKPQQDIGLLAAQMIFEEFPQLKTERCKRLRHSASMRSSCACAMPAKIETIAIAISRARLHPVRARSRAPAGRGPLVWASVDGDGCAQARSMPAVYQRAE